MEEAEGEEEDEDEEEREEEDEEVVDKFDKEEVLEAARLAGGTS